MCLFPCCWSCQSTIWDHLRSITPKLQTQSEASAKNQGRCWSLPLLGGDSDHHPRSRVRNRPSGIMQSTPIKRVYMHSLWIPSGVPSVVPPCNTIKYILWYVVVVCVYIDICIHTHIHTLYNHSRLCIYTYYHIPVSWNPMCFIPCVSPSISWSHAMPRPRIQPSPGR